MKRYTLNKRVTPSIRKDVANIIGSPRNVNKSPTGVPQFPAFNSNMSMQDVRQFMQMQPRCTGINFNVPIGQSTLGNINLPGDARLFLGLVFNSVADVNDTFNMTLNNNKIIDNGSIFLHSGQNNYSVTTQYFEYLQPLTGKDVFKFDLVTLGGFTGVLQLHYI